MADASIKIRGGAGNAVQIQSRDIDAAAPSDTEVLAWNATDAEWEPTSAGAGVTSEWNDTGTVLHPTDSSGTLDNVVIGGTSLANSDIALGVDGAAVFNEQGAAVDFRVEGDTLTHLLFVDGSADKIGINTSTPDALLEISTAANADDVDVFSITEYDGNERIAIEADFNTNGNPALLKSSAFGTSDPIMKIFTTGGRVETRKSALVKSKAQTVLTGSIDPAASTTVTGLNTQFLSQVAIGDSILVTGETRVVTAIASDTSLTVSVAFSDNANDTSPEVLPCPLTVLQSDGSLALAVNSSNEVSADGAIALKSQSSSASATADYAKIYTEEYGNDANTKLLLHCDGSNDGEDFEDSSASDHDVTAGGVLTKTAVKRFGSASAYFAGGDYLSTTASSDFEITGDFTVEMWINPSALTNYRRLIGYGVGAGWDAATGWCWNWTINVTTNKPEFHYLISNDLQNSLGVGNTAVVDGVWQHLAVTRSGNIFRYFYNGLLDFQVSDSTAMAVPSGTNTLGIGRFPGGPGTYDYEGYMDEIVVTKGEAKYTTNFTPAKSAFPTTNIVIVDDNGGEYKLGRNW